MTTTTTETEWALRWESGCGSHISNYGASEAAARAVIRDKAVGKGTKLTLLKRTVTVTETEWETTP